MDNPKNQDLPATCDIKADVTFAEGYRLQDFQDKDACAHYAGPGRHQSRARKLGRAQLTPLN